MQLTKSSKSKESNWITSECLGKGEYNLTYHFTKFVERPLSDCMINAVDQIKLLSKDKSLGLFLSGGIDSSLIAHYMTETNTDFLPVIIRYDHDLNAHDVNNALDVTNKLGLDPLILDITHTEFTDYYNEVAIEKYVMPSYSRNQLYWATEKLGKDYYMICGEGEPRIFKYQTKDVLGMEMKPDWIRLTDRFNQISGCSLHHQFYETTPDLWYNYHRHPEVIKLQDSQKDIKNFKKRIWGSEYANPKYTGFENWRMYYDKQPPPERIEKINALMDEYSLREPMTLNYNKFWSWMLSPDTQAHINDLR